MEDRKHSVLAKKVFHKKKTGRENENRFATVTTRHIIVWF